MQKARGKESRSHTLGLVFHCCAADNELDALVCQAWKLSRRPGAWVSGVLCQPAEYMDPTASPAFLRVIFSDDCVMHTTWPRTRCGDRIFLKESDTLLQVVRAAQSRSLLQFT